MRAVLIVSLLVLFGCSTVAVPRPEEVSVNIPDRPTFKMLPVIGPCLLPTANSLQCVQMRLDDWQKVRLYYHELEREV
ncbi:MAG: hypothetical protein ACRDGM_16350, partial [bacterium]